MYNIFAVSNYIISKLVIQQGDFIDGNSLGRIVLLAESNYRVATGHWLTTAYDSSCDEKGQSVPSFEMTRFANAIPAAVTGEFTGYEVPDFDDKAIEVMNNAVYQYNGHMMFGTIAG